MLEHGSDKCEWIALSDACINTHPAGKFSSASDCMPYYEFRMTWILVQRAKPRVNGFSYILEGRISPPRQRVALTTVGWERGRRSWTNTGCHRLPILWSLRNSRVLYPIRRQTNTAFRLQDKLKLITCLKTLLASVTFLTMAQQSASYVLHFTRGAISPLVSCE